LKNDNAQNAQVFDYSRTKQPWYTEQTKCREEFDRLVDRVSHVTDLIDQKVKALGYATYETNTDGRSSNDRQ
jgi:hypothetical protein